MIHLVKILPHHNFYSFVPERGGVADFSGEVVLLQPDYSVAHEATIDFPWYYDLPMGAVGSWRTRIGLRQSASVRAHSSLEDALRFISNTTHQQVSITISSYA